jgi:hypothetical protein
MSLESHLNFLECSQNHILFYCCDMFRHYKAILRQLLIDWNRRTLSPPMSIYYVLLLHRRCLRMYAHTSLTLSSYCGVHAVFLSCIALPSRACIRRIWDVAAFKSIKFQIFLSSFFDISMFSLLLPYYHRLWGEDASFMAFPLMSTSSARGSISF